MKCSHFLSLAIAATISLSAWADEGRLMRFPATNGADVAFSYAGDIYTVPIAGGVAKRLTSHNGYEMFARFSPDGKTIAFTGQYDGNTEIFVMPREGGEPKRITFTSTNSRDEVADRMGPNNIAMTWTPDGKGVVYRNRIGDGFTGKLWIAPLDGGMPQELPLPEGGFCSYSPDGKRLAYNRVFREFRTWKYYKGGMADDIWIYDSANKSVTNITNSVGQDIAPMWIGDEIYYISDRDNRMNIFVYNTVTKATSKVTDFTDYDVKFPSCGGGVIVFENAGYIYRLDPATKKYSKITVELNHEGSFARSEVRHVAEFARGFNASPDGKRLCIGARGDIFDVPVEKGVTRNVTRSSGVHDRDGAWSPDGKTIAYISDASGETEIWLHSTIDGKNSQLTSGNDTYIRSLAWSNDGKHILYTDRRNRAVLVDVAAKSKRTLFVNPTGEIALPKFSPDDKWLVYTKDETNEMRVIYLYSIEQNKEYPVTERWYDSSQPAFSTDGKYLFFTSSRDFNPIYSSVEWNFAYTQMDCIYFTTLAADTPSPFLESDSYSTKSEKTDAPKPEADKKKGKNADAKSDEAKPVTVKVDIEGIADRIVRVPLGTGRYYSLASDGKTLYYNGNGGVHAYDLAKQKDENIAPNANMRVMPGMKKVIINQGGKVYVTDLPKGKANLSNPVDLNDMVCHIDYAQEWAQIYDETWRAFRDGFYLENMHGVDWKAIHDKYAVLLPYVKNRIDLTYVIGAMISELACGHAYVDGGDYIAPQRLKMGLLGAKLSQQGGYFRIDKIYAGAPDRKSLHSPLADQGLNVKEGDYITAIDGVSTASTPNIYSLLVAKAGVLTELTINSKPEEGGRKIVIRPIADEYPLVHYEWIQRNIEYVNKKSGGRIGYIYIPDMGPEGLNEFARYFYPQIDKEALIIDDRANGGGNISPMIIERLLRQPYRMTMYRGSTHNGTNPDKVQYGPKALLVNKYSASDGDLFPWSFKKNKIGPVIGTRSWGGIIGISGSLPYIDGTDVRVPFFTNYDTTGEWIVENHGVDPDIVIDNDPIREFNGEDQQLDKAIEVLLEQLKDRKPLPGTPAPRTLKDLGVE